MLESVSDWWRRLTAGLRSGAKPGAAGREAVLGVFALTGVDLKACRGLREGEETGLEAVDQPPGGVAVCHRGSRLGLLPAAEAARLRDLSARGARLGCRVVRWRPNADDQALRVRVSILM